MALVKTVGAIVPTVQAMRPKQWTKNLLLFAGVVFSHNLNDVKRLALAALGFALFCGLSGVVYIINDLRDIEGDRLHPVKCQRPIASGALSPGLAIWAAALIGLVCLLASYMLNTPFGVIATVYFVLMVLYSIILKHIVILDLMVVAIGFVIRAIAGIWAIEQPGQRISITPWFITCVLFLALFIAICKRRHELVLFAGSGKNHRPVLEHYSTAFLDQMVSVTTAATVISYALYVIAGAKGTLVTQALVDARRHEEMIYTLPFVLYGIFRYLYLVYRRDEGGAPEALFLQDPWLLVNVLLWLLTMIIILYR